MKRVGDTFGGGGGGVNGLCDRDRGEDSSLINDRVYSTNGIRRSRSRLITPTDLLRTRITPISILLSRCLYRRYYSPGRPFLKYVVRVANRIIVNLVDFPWLYTCMH